MGAARGAPRVRCGSADALWRRLQVQGNGPEPRVLGAGQRHHHSHHHASSLSEESALPLR